MKQLLKKIYLKLFCGRLFTRVKDMGKGSFIRGKRILVGRKYIHIGERTKIYPYSRLCCFDSYGGQKYKPTIKIGNDCSIKSYFTILSAGNVEIGNQVTIASHVFISNENYGINPETKYASQPLLVKDVHICDNVWIGEKVIILPGVTIGKFAVIGAGSVVTKDVPPYSIACGNPARVIKVWDADKKEWTKVN